MHRRCIPLALACLTLIGCAQIKGDARTLADATPLPATTITKLTLERGGCFGTCPTYSVTFAKGDIATYNGKRYADRIGKFSGHVDFDLVAAWLDTQQLPETSSSYGRNVIDTEIIVLTIVRSDRTVVLELHNYFDTPLAVSGVVAAIDGFADRIVWKPMSALDSYLGYFINDKSSTKLMTVTLYAGDADASGSSHAFIMNGCAPGGFTSNEDEISLRLAGSTATSVFAKQIPFRRDGASTAVPLAVKFGAGTITLGTGSTETTYRRISGREYDATVRAFERRSAGLARPPDCTDTGPH